MKSLTRASRRHLAALAVVALALVGLTGGAFTAALFTDSDAIGSNGFTAATVSLTTSPASALFYVTSMLPGDSTIASLVLTNAGSAQLRYALTTSATNTDGKGFKDQLTLDIRTKTANPCSTFDGTSLYSGALSAGAIGNPQTGNQTGDRTLASSATETLCFKVSLASNTPDTYQAATTTATFTFASEQTANNP